MNVLVEAIPKSPTESDRYRSLESDNAVAENDVRAFGVAPSNFRTPSDYRCTEDGDFESEPSRPPGSVV